MTPKVSVIIPVYNVEQYLPRCVDSVLRQTLKDLEIILIDDGSPDNAPAICDRYAASDERITAFHKENGGLASARNAGMRLAKGEYIFFLDSDDWLEPDGLEMLCGVAERYPVDFVRFRAIRTGWPGLPENAPCMVEPVRELAEGLYDRERIRKEVFPRLLATPQLTMGAVVGAWGSLYRRDFLEENHLYFYEEVKFSEDLVFSARVVRAAKAFYFVDKAGVYHYFYNPNSISKSFRAGRWKSCKETIRLVERDFAGDGEFDFSDQLNWLRWFCVCLSLNERKHLTSRKERVEYCRAILDDPAVGDLQIRHAMAGVPWKQRVFMLLVKGRFYRVVAGLK